MFRKEAADATYNVHAYCTLVWECLLFWHAATNEIIAVVCRWPHQLHYGRSSAWARYQHLLLDHVHIHTTTSTRQTCRNPRSPPWCRELRRGWQWNSVPLLLPVGPIHAVLPGKPRKNDLSAIYRLWTKLYQLLQICAYVCNFWTQWPFSPWQYKQHHCNTITNGGHQSGEWSL